MSIRLLAVLSVFVGVMAFGWMASAQSPDEEGEVAVVADADSLSAAEADRGKFVALAIGFGLAIAALGGTLAQGRATAACMDGLCRNPGAYDKVFTPFILGLVLIESLVIYSLVISLILLGSLG